MNVSKNEMAFDAWFGRNYDKLKTKCVPYTLFGELYDVSTEDIFHDAYLVARNSVLSSDETEFETIFVAAYKRQSKFRYSANKKEIRPSDLFWSLLRSYDESEKEQTETRKQQFEDLATRIKKFAFVSFSADEYTIFEMYFRHSFSFNEIGQMYGVSGVGVGKRINHMKHVLCFRFEDDFTNLL